MQGLLLLRSWNTTAWLLCDPPPALSQKVIIWIKLASKKERGGGREGGKGSSSLCCKTEQDNLLLQYEACKEVGSFVLINILLAPPSRWNPHCARRCTNKFIVKDRCSPSSGGGGERMQSTKD